MSENQLNGALKSLREFSDTQKTALDKLSNDIKLLENSDIIREYELLKADFDVLSKKAAALREREKKLSAENDSLRNALAGQIFSLRMSAIKTSEKNLEIFFGKSENESLNALSAFENRVKTRIRNMRAALDRHHIESTAPIADELNAVSRHLDEIIAAERALHNTDAFTAEEKNRINELKNAPLTDEQIKKAAHKNNIESFIGSNLINKIGIVLIIIGVTALLRFSSFNAPDEIKSVIMLLFGAVFTLCGEFMNRKHPGFFSVGCTACGIAVMFATLAVSYFSFGILPMYAALALCILITAAAFALSARYRSQTIFTFAQIGGYIPIAAVFENEGMIYGAMVYFMILNISSLAAAFKYKWTVCEFAGTILNIIGTYCIWFTGSSQQINAAIVTAYLFVSFLIYTTIPITGTLRSSRIFKISDVVMLALNTVFSSIILFIACTDFYGKESLGILAVILTTIYTATGYVVGKNKMRPLFFITALAFSVMIIPLQFGHAWISLAWLAEGALLIMYGILKNEKNFRRYGMPVYALCAAGFLIIDVICRIDFLFFAKYTALTLSAVMITVCYIVKNMQHSGFARAFKYISAVNLWFYIIYISYKIGSIPENHIPAGASTSLSALSTLSTLTFLALTLSLAYTLLNLRTIRDTGTIIIAYILYAAGLISSLFLPSGYSADLSIGMKWLCGSLIVIGDILCIISAVDFARHIAANSKFGIQWYPPAVSVYLVILIAAEFMGKFGLSFTHTAITVTYAAIAFIQIIAGFAFRFPYLRRFGLALSLLSAVKLFILDLSNLSGGYRIICYFALGASFMAVSFIYQIFEKKFVAEVSANEKFIQNNSDETDKNDD